MPLEIYLADMKDYLETSTWFSRILSGMQHGPKLYFGQICLLFSSFSIFERDQ